MKLKSKIKNAMINSNLSYNQLLRIYMYERFIQRLSISSYNENLILKGGYCLSYILKNTSRFTYDLDFTLHNISFEKSDIKKMILKILSIDLNDDMIIKLNYIEEILNESDYGGYRINITVTNDKIKETYNIDIATNDIVTPKPKSLKMNCILDDEYIEILSYNLETIIAEKIDSIFEKVEYSSRMKDYFDIYTIILHNTNLINFDNVKQAITNTTRKRKREYNYNELMLIISSSNSLKLKWYSYCISNNYSIEFNDVCNVIKKILEYLC